MKKTLLKLLAIAAITTTATISLNYSLQNSPTDPHIALLSRIEALASDKETTGTIICRCSKIMDQSCASNNKGSQCASGDNIHCENWNNNCHINM